MPPSTLTQIALMQQDIKYIREIIDKLSNDIWWMWEKFASKEWLHIVEKRVETIEKEKKSLIMETLKYIAMAIWWMVFTIIAMKLWIK